MLLKDCKRSDTVFQSSKNPLIEDKGRKKFKRRFLDSLDEAVQYDVHGLNQLKNQDNQSMVEGEKIQMQPENTEMFDYRIMKVHELNDQHKPSVHAIPQKNNQETVDLTVTNVSQILDMSRFKQTRLINPRFSNPHGHQKKNPNDITIDQERKHHQDSADVYQPESIQLEFQAQSNEDCNTPCLSQLRMGHTNNRQRLYRMYSGRTESPMAQNQLSFKLTDDEDNGLLHKMEGRINAMQPENTESFIQMKRFVKKPKVNSVEANRGGFAVAGEKEGFEGYETPTSSQLRHNQLGDSSMQKSPEAALPLAQETMEIGNRIAEIHNSSSNPPGTDPAALSRQQNIIQTKHNEQSKIQTGDIVDPELDLALLQSQLSQRTNLTAYDKKSLYIFKKNGKFRQKLIQLVDSRTFEYIMVGVILLNSLVLSLYDYNDRDSKYVYNQVLDKMNIFFTAIFILEALMKIIAKGLIFHKDSFLRNGWNIIDTAVVISGILELTFGSVKLKALRVVRVFRPLKSINVIPSMKQLIQALIQSLPDFANVGTFLVYVFILFATMGVHQYNGVFYNICRYHETPEFTDQWMYDPSINRVCSQSGLGNYICPSGMYCGNNDEHLDINIATDNLTQRAYINYGITNFDNIGTSLLSVFQIINSDTWYEQLQNFMDVDIPIFGAIYCFMMIVVGQFFLMNLILAVIIFAFIKTQKRELQIEIMAMSNNQFNYEDTKSEAGGGSSVHSSQQLQAQETIMDDIMSQRPSYKREFGQPFQRQVSAQIEGSEERRRVREERRKKRQQEGNFASFLNKQAKKRRIINMFKKKDGTGLQGPLGCVLDPMDMSESDRNEDNQEDNMDDGCGTLTPANMKDLLCADTMTQQPQRNLSRFAHLSAQDFGQGQSQDTSSQDDLSQDDDFEQPRLLIMDEERVQNSNQLLNIPNHRFQQPNIIVVPLSGTSDPERVKKQQQKPTISIVEMNSSPSHSSSNRQPIEEGSPATVLAMKVPSLRLPKSKNATDLIKSQMGLHFQSEANRKRQMLEQSGSSNSSSADPNHKQKSAFNKNNSIAKAFRKFIRRKIEQEYGKRIKRMLQEAKDNYQREQVRQDSTALQANMRELANLKVSLEFLKQQQKNIKQLDALDEMEERTQSRLIYYWSFRISESKSFLVILSLLIMLNTVVLALDKYPIDIQQTTILEKVNIVFTLIFVFEMVIKILAVGIKYYFKGSLFNVFDSVIVLASIADIFVSNFILTQSEETSGSVITALRGFRLLRIFKLAKSWKRFELLLETLGRTLIDIATFTILLFLFIFTFTLLGLEIFAQRAKFIDDVPIDPSSDRYVYALSPVFNFDNFLNSFTTVFIVLTNENMSEIYYDYYRGVGALTSTVYFILLAIIGQKILLNLFLAILLENFDEGALKLKNHDDLQEMEEKKQQYLSIWERCKIVSSHLFLKIQTWCRRGKTYEDKDNMLKKLKVIEYVTKGTLNTNVNQIIQRMEAGEPILEGKSFNLLTTENKFRIFLYQLVNNKKFDYFIILVIILSSIQLALDSPLMDPESQMKKSLFWIDVSTTVIFVMEFTLKVLVYGFIFNGKSSYLRQTWNMLDFGIIIFSFMAISPLPDNLRTLKIFRVMRILRLISKNDELKVAVRALFLALPNVANVTIIMMLFFLIFGIIAVSYFKGKLYHCQGEMEELSGQMIHKWDCLDSGGEWQNQVFNFDNVLKALITLFVLSTVSGWAEVMMQCATSTQIDYIASETASPVWIFFFIVFIIVGAFFFINLFVGVVISTFNSEHDKLGGNNLLTDKQKEWIDLRLLVLRSTPSRKLTAPQGKIRQVFFKIANSIIFENIILTFIIINTVVLMTKWYQQPQALDLFTEILNYFFTAFFIVEASIKMVAYGPKVYFEEGWNKFDTLIIIGSFISIFISANTSLEIRGAITILRSFRILRLLRLIKRGKSLQLIFNTFVITLHSLANIGGLLLLFIFMYAILGMLLFGEVKRQGIMSAYINFENFVNSFITLFVAATGDSWDIMMANFATELSPSNKCIPNPTYEDYLANGSQTIGCGNLGLSWVYFISYTFVVNLIFLKIFIAIILQGYNDTQTQDSRLFNNDMNDKFREVWTEFDPNASTFIKLSQLRDFLFALGKPLGFDRSYEVDRFLQDTFIASLELPTYHNFSSYQYLDVLDALSFRLMVLEHIEKNKLEHQAAANKLKRRYSNTLKVHCPLPPLRQNTKEEKEIKLQLQKDINRLIYNSKCENITAVKEVSDKEQKRQRLRLQNRDKSGLTSIHHMAAEATVRRMRYFLQRKKGLISSISHSSSISSRHGVERENASQRSSMRSQLSSSLLHSSFSTRYLLGNQGGAADTTELQRHRKRGTIKSSIEQVDDSALEKINKAVNNPQALRREAEEYCARISHQNNKEHELVKKSAHTNIKQQNHHHHFGARHLNVMHQQQDMNGGEFTSSRRKQRMSRYLSHDIKKKGGVSNTQKFKNSKQYQQLWLDLQQSTVQSRTSGHMPEGIFIEQELQESERMRQATKDFGEPKSNPVPPQPQVHLSDSKEESKNESHHYHHHHHQDNERIFVLLSSGGLQQPRRQSKDNQGAGANLGDQLQQPKSLDVNLLGFAPQNTGALGGFVRSNSRRIRLQKGNPAVSRLDQIVDIPNDQTKERNAGYIKQKEKEHRQKRQKAEEDTYRNLI